MRASINSACTIGSENQPGERTTIHENVCASSGPRAAHAPGLTPRAVLDKLAGIQMLDVWLPATDGRFLVMPRHTEPDHEQALLLHKLNLQLPPQPPPRIRAKAASLASAPLKM